MPGAAAFADLIAVGVVIVMAVALHQQAVAFDVGQVGGGQVALAQQVTGRVVGEAFRRGTTDVDQAVQRVVVKAAIALAAVIDPRQVAVGIVSVATLEQAAILLADAMSLQPALFVVLILAEQQTLLALPLPTATELVGGQARAVEVDAVQLAAALVVVIQLAAIREAAVFELADAVVLVAQRAPALVFGDEAVLQVVFVTVRLPTSTFTFANENPASDHLIRHPFPFLLHEVSERIPSPCACEFWPLGCVGR